ncbi:MAG: AGE family epimerase/isomerase [Candidatus Bipolaricaulia bacterium]
MSNNCCNNFNDPNFVEDHAIETIEFYLPQCVDKEGGFYGGYLDDGTVYEAQTRDLVSTTRFILNFSFGNLITDSDRYSEYLQHGLEFLIESHKDEKNGGYHQTIEKDVPQKSRKKMYGQAFVLCALSNAYKAGFTGVEKHIDEIFELTDEHFWESEHKLYAAEATNDFSRILPYRGQNCNMHMVEALLAAYEATGKEKYLNRAYKVAKKIVIELSRQSDGKIWEHYNTDWKMEPDYNKEDPNNLYRPYGFLPGHFTEWSKLLLILKRYRPDSWELDRSKSLFKKAIKYGWDEENRGLNYTFDFNGAVLNDDKYYWVHAETIAAAYLLWHETGQDSYLNWYKKIWDYSCEHLVDDRYGGWYRLVNNKGEPLSNKKSNPSKTGYHVIGACREIAKTMRNRPQTDQS